MWTERQAIEVFHLIFVAHLGRRVDKALFAIKGGCNLRFFCRSIRYSEDIENAMTIGFDEFSGQVRAYLDADYQEYYGTRKVWETLQQQVVDALEKRQP